MCYDMPVPKCSQTPCQTSGQCSAGTSACSNQQSNTATVCPQAAAGQPKPPYASGGCQQVIFFLIKVRIFQEGHKIWENLHRRFDTYYILSNRR